MAVRLGPVTPPTAEERARFRCLQYRCGRCSQVFGGISYLDTVIKDVVDHLVRGDSPRPEWGGWGSESRLHNTHWCPDGAYGVGVLIGYEPEPRQVPKSGYAAYQDFMSSLTEEQRKAMDAACLLRS